MLYTWFTDTARRFPDTTALEVGGHHLTYAQLRGLAERAASVVGGRRVGLHCSRNVSAYVGYLAALCAGATVVPLSPGAPFARNQAICRAASVDVVVSEDPAAAGLVPSGRFVHMTGATVTGASVACSSAADDVAYVLFTSGSTGRPKGVPIRQHQLAEYLPYCVDRYQVGPGCRLSQAFDLTFDPSVFDMFVAWTSGATLVVPQPDEVLTPAGFVAGHGISHWFSVPSVISLARRLRGLRPGSMPHLRWALFAGEQLTRAQAAAFASAAPGATVENLYGPTELTITCTGYRLPPDQDAWPLTGNGTVPIGQPYPHLEATVGRDGELCVRGSQRFDGYLDPADNAGRFVRIENGVASPVSGPPAQTHWYRTGDRVRWEGGELVHVGRIDDQVKIDGHRVEPAEVEAGLRALDGVDEVVVIPVDDHGRTTLCALYTGESRPDVPERLRDRLPGYLVPAEIRHVPSFPVTTNGKIDRATLRRMVTPS
ncbi:AMP-binding protein [Kibdelosporangium persicum]|uniref:Non-ribosomal peptide synthase amino acid adenylation subunit n=1 Tax=Kibdelosporangium persicum TaxID=2698649 RepID=A0ABX2FE55_9PSEU|nr:AMP-binding protein [Kibdelosporangium persicum]NRN69419.1 Non-ribosomal peptide synthase amino acid adenylation subunit [Kibdelosporangium persicum]